MKNRFTSDYERIGAGNYRYIGKYFTLPMNEVQKKKAGWWNLVFVGLIFAAVVAAGLVNQDSSRTLWIAIPYFCLFLPVAYMGIGAVSFWQVPLRMEHSAYENSLMQMRRSCKGVILLDIINMFLVGIYLVIHRNHGVQTGREICYLACLFLIFVIGIGYGLLYDRLYSGIIVDE